MADEMKAGIIGERWAKDSDALAEGVLIKNESATVGFALVRGWGGVPTREECEQIAARIVVEHNAFEPMRAALRAVEWVRDDLDMPRCPTCYHARHDGHEPGCKLAAALRAADGETEGQTK